MSVRENHKVCCPRCGRDDDLEIEAVIHTPVTLHEDGTDNKGGDIEWDNKSDADCMFCGWSGTVGQMYKAFMRVNKVVSKLVPVLHRDVDGDEINAAIIEYDREDLPKLRRTLKEMHQKCNQAAKNHEELAIDQVADMEQLTIALTVFTSLKRSKDCKE